MNSEHGRAKVEVVVQPWRSLLMRAGWDRVRPQHRPQAPSAPGTVAHSNVAPRCALTAALPRGDEHYFVVCLASVSRIESYSMYLTHSILGARESARTRDVAGQQMYTHGARCDDTHTRGAPETVSLIECQSAEYDLSSTQHSRQPIISSFTWVVSHARTSQRSGFLQSPVLPSAAVRIGRLAWTLEFSSPAPSSLPAALSLTCR